MSRSSSLLRNMLLDEKVINCAMCSKLLLSPPIMLVENVGNLCISCHKENFLESKFVHNTMLEQLIKIFPYPCRYFNNGCETETTCTNLMTHEENCHYRNMQCPATLATGCTWEDYSAKFVEHFLHCHQEHVIKIESNVFNIDTALDEIDLVKLLVIKDIYLLLKMQMNLKKNKLLYMICNVKKAGENFDYSVEHKGNTGNCLKIRARILDSSFVFKNLIDERDVETINLTSLKHTVDITNRIMNIFKMYEYDASSYKISKNMLNIFECPVCNIYMKSPIYQCKIGHSICSHCKPRLNTCPTCRHEFEGCTSRNYSLESLAEIVSYPCPHYNAGCVISLPLSKIADHEVTCRYKPYKCPISDCIASLCSDSLIIHLQENHRDKIVICDTNSYSGTADLSDLFFYKKVLLAFDQIFRLTFNKSDDSCTFAVQAIIDNRDIKNIFYEVSVIDNDCPERSLFATDRVLKDMKDRMVDSDDYNKIGIHFSADLLQTYSKDDNITYNFKLKKIA